MVSTSSAQGTMAGNSSQQGVARQQSAQSTRSEKRKNSILQSICSWRTVIVLHMHFSIVIFMLLKMNMPMALVCMLRPQSGNVTDVDQGLNISFVDEDFDQEKRNGSFRQSTSTGEFDWDSSTQGLLITSSNILGFILPLMTDVLSRKMGAKMLLFLSTAMSCACTLLVPVGARLSPYLLMALRLVGSFVGGVTLPIISEVISWWAPEDEKVSMMSFALAGINTGSILMSITTGYLCSIPIDHGWPFIFYVQGAIALAWCLLWLFTGSMRPEDHPFVSEEEKEYIKSTRLAMGQSKKGGRPPYKAICSSLPVWGFLGVGTAHYFSVTIFFAYLPLYLATALGFTIEQVGLITSVGYLLRFGGVLFWGQVSNFLLRTVKLSVTTCRKLVQCTAFYMCMGAVLVLGFMEERIPALAMVVLAMLLQCATMGSGMITPLDMAPRYAGFLSGMFFTTATIASLPGPIIASIMTQHGTLEEWRNVFILMAAVFCAGATCFLFLGDGKLQAWAIPPERRQEEDYMPSYDADMVARQLTVLAMGTPMSPSGDQTRFDFSRKQQLNFEGATYERSGNISPLPTITTTMSDLFNSNMASQGLNFITNRPNSNSVSHAVSPPVVKGSTVAGHPKTAKGNVCTENDAAAGTNANNKDTARNTKHACRKAVPAHENAAFDNESDTIDDRTPGGQGEPSARLGHSASAQTTGQNQEKLQVNNLSVRRNSGLKLNISPSDPALLVAGQDTDNEQVSKTENGEEYPRDVSDSESKPKCNCVLYS